MPPVLTPQVFGCRHPLVPSRGDRSPQSRTFAELLIDATRTRRFGRCLSGRSESQQGAEGKRAEGLERSLSPTPTLRLAGAEPRARDGRTLARAHAETVATALGVEAPSGVCVLVNELCVLTCPTEDTSGVVTATDLRQDGHGHA